MTDRPTKTSLATVALIAGLSLLIMVMAAPFAEIYVYPKLVISDNPALTVKNISANQTLFIGALFGYIITFICDLIVAWALYVFLKPVNESLSLLTALFRLVYTVIALAALLNLVTVWRLLTTADLLKLFEPSQLQAEVMLSLNAFRSGFHFGILFFGIHLVLLGYLVFKSNYIPSLIGALVVISGLGYLLTTLRPFLFPSVNIDFAVYTYYGELIFMGWLLIKGRKIPELRKSSLLETETT